MGPEASAARRRLLALTAAALGVVYGDIGTSPLYALRECFFGHASSSVRPSSANVLGILSLFFWSLTIVVSVKYVLVLLRANNQGEGGILSLVSLLPNLRGKGPADPRIPVAVLLACFGAALLLGDGMITPAISVLSAVEGLEIAAPGLAKFVVPLTVVILIALFQVQRLGTARVGAFFGPITLLWFASLAALGVRQIVQRPEVFAALNPLHMVRFLSEGGSAGYLVLGSVFLVVTGGEALYADMGHFGPRPIRLTWFWVVFPALLLNYFGQGALLLGDPDAASNPFYRMAPGWALYPLIVLSTLATVIASQAMISGAFSVTRQAVMLGYLPRLNLVHTSAREIGQIFVPDINRVLMLASIGLVIGFGSSSRLAAAYGIAVNLDMIITSLLAYVVARRVWGWSLPAAMSVTLTLFAFELAFLGANALKVLDGGWFPLVVGVAMMTLLTTWKSGRALLADRIQARMSPLDEFIARILREGTPRVHGTAVYMSGASNGTPPALLTNFKHNHVVHQHVILLTILTEEVARVPHAERVKVEPLEHGFCRVIGHYGFMDDPDVPALLARAHLPAFKPDDTTYYLGRETLIPTKHPGMALWREKLFAFMARNARPATAHFKLPVDRVMEIGAQIEI